MVIILTDQKKHEQFLKLITGQFFKRFNRPFVLIVDQHQSPFDMVRPYEQALKLFITKLDLFNL